MRLLCKPWQDLLGLVRTSVNPLSTQLMGMLPSEKSATITSHMVRWSSSSPVDGFVLLSRAG